MPTNKRIHLDEEQIDYAVRCGLTHLQIAKLFGVNVNTLQKHYSELMREAKKNFKSRESASTKVSLIDPKVVRKLAKEGYKVTAISRILCVTPEALRENYQEHFASGHEEYTGNILKQQRKILNSGNAAMAIHLGKTELDQIDKKEVLHKNQNLEQISITFVEPSSTPVLAEPGTIVIDGTEDYEIITTEDNNG